jgi:hypothetical protein
MSEDKPKPNTDINDTKSDSNEERINQGDKPKVAYRDPETGETKERDASTDGAAPAVVFPEPTGTDGPR